MKKRPYQNRLMFMIYDYFIFLKYVHRAYKQNKPKKKKKKQPKTKTKTNQN